MLGYLLNIAFWKTQDAWQDVLTEFQLTPKAFNALTLICLEPDLSIGQLARLTRTKQPSLTRILQRLENVGYISRQVDANDRRFSYFRATEKGQEVHQALLLRSDSLETVFLEGIDERDRQSLRTALLKIIENLEQRWG